MDEVFQQEQDQSNESGIDMHDCYHHHHPLERNNNLSWHEKNRILLDGFNKIRPLIQPESKPIAQRNCANPF